jgi:hypothetical protein
MTQARVDSKIIIFYTESTLYKNSLGLYTGAICTVDTVQLLLYSVDCVTNCDLIINKCWCYFEV